jgi:hypothetical protein
MSFFILFDQCKFEVYFEINIATPAVFMAIGLVNLLSAFHPKPVFVSVN